MGLQGQTRWKTREVGSGAGMGGAVKTAGRDPVSSEP